MAPSSASNCLRTGRVAWSHNNGICNYGFKKCSCPSARACTTNRKEGARRTSDMDGWGLEATMGGAGSWGSGMATHSCRCQNMLCSARLISKCLDDALPACLQREPAARPAFAEVPDVHDGVLQHARRQAPGSLCVAHLRGAGAAEARALRATTPAAS
eukprot:232127-Alexandrium_andersonii.AAC.1